MAKHIGRFKVRKPFGFLPSIVWVIALDLVDVVPNIINTLLIALGVTAPAGVVLDGIVDFIQTGLLLAIFEKPQELIFGAIELVVPPPFDVFPTFTGIYLYKTFWDKK